VGSSIHRFPTTLDVTALTCDVFGTVVDWRSGVIRDGERHPPDHDVDRSAFADD
jgi:2-haloacid dehalogenase